MFSKDSNWGNWKGHLLDAYFTSIPLIMANVVWFLLSLPVVTIFPALAGLYYSTNLIARDSDGGGRAVWHGFRAHFLLSFRWGLLVAAGLLLFGVNFWFYSQIETRWAWLPRSLSFTLIVIWVAINLYTFPLLVEQEKAVLRTALRNSLVIWLKRPFHSVFLLAACSLVAWASTFYFPLAWVFITAALCTYMANRTVVSSIDSWPSPS